MANAKPSAPSPGDSVIEFTAPDGSKKRHTIAELVEFHNKSSGLNPEEAQLGGLLKRAIGGDQNAHAELMQKFGGQSPVASQQEPQSPNPESSALSEEDRKALEQVREFNRKQERATSLQTVKYFVEAVKDQAPLTHKMGASETVLEQATRIAAQARQFPGSGPNPDTLEGQRAIIAQAIKQVESGLATVQRQLLGENGQASQQQAASQLTQQQQNALIDDQPIAGQQRMGGFNIAPIDATGFAPTSISGQPVPNQQTPLPQGQTVGTTSQQPAGGMTVDQMRAAMRQRINQGGQ